MMLMLDTQRKCNNDIIIVITTTATIRNENANQGQYQRGK